MSAANENIFLVTGCAGFIAGHLTETLIELFPDNLIIGIDKISYCSCKSVIEKLDSEKNGLFYQIDLTKIDQIEQLFENHKITHVFHLAAYTHVDSSFGLSIEYTKNNVLATHNLLEVCTQKAKPAINKFIHVSTDEVYGTIDDQTNENALLKPTNPYAATKAAAEMIVQSYIESFNFPAVIVRSNNIYGTRQYPEKLIPRFSVRMTLNIPCQVQGTGNQKRSFLNIGDLIDALILIEQQGQIGQIYNVGSTNEYSVNEIYEILANFFLDDYQELQLEYVEDREFNDQRYHLDYGKIGDLGWRERVDFNKGIEEVVQWYRKKSNWEEWSEEAFTKALEIESSHIRFDLEK